MAAWRHQINEKGGRGYTRNARSGVIKTIKRSTRRYDRREARKALKADPDLIINKRRYYSYAA